MEDFNEMIEGILSTFEPNDLRYNEDEFWLIEGPYNYLKAYAEEKRLKNTAIALPLARGLHNGSYRKSRVVKDGVSYRQPYLIHPLIVCRMLAELNMPLADKDIDIILAASLCHDMIEDIDFRDHGKELYTVYQLDKEVYDTIKLVSKRYDFTEEEERMFFHRIESDYHALLVKLSDRSNNVEDMYNMSVWKVHEYINETNKRFLPMINYGLEHYPKLTMVIEILRDKIMTLTEISETLTDRYDEELKVLRSRKDSLLKENEELKRGME